MVAIDASLSMETQDGHASLSEKLRWAQALGMLGNSDTTALIEQWVVDCRRWAMSRTGWVHWKAPPANPVEQASRGSDSREKQIRETLDELATMPRTEFVRRLLQSQPRMLLEQLEEVMPVDVRLFATQQQNAAPEELSRLPSV